MRFAYTSRDYVPNVTCDSFIPDVALLLRALALLAFLELLPLLTLLTRSWVYSSYPRIDLN